MITILITVALFIQACGAERVNYTVFLKEVDQKFYNLKGAICLESGYQLDQKGTRLITYYSNCDIHQERVLQEFETKQWIPIKEKK